MKTTKMSLTNIQGKLSRTEMKNIMAGSGTGCDDNSSGACNLNQAACVFAGKSGKAKNYGKNGFVCCC